MGQVPSAWNALPPLLHLANSYSSFKTQLQRHLLQEASPAVTPSVPARSRPRPPTICLSLSPQQTVSSLRAGMRTLCLPVLDHVHLAPGRCEDSLNSIQCVPKGGEEALGASARGTGTRE